jgi:hypothetical protein
VPLCEEGLTGNEPVVRQFNEAVRGGDAEYESSDTFWGARLPLPRLGKE